MHGKDGSGSHEHGFSRDLRDMFVRSDVWVLNGPAIIDTRKRRVHDGIQRPQSREQVRGVIQVVEQIDDIPRDLVFFITEFRLGRGLEACIVFTALSIRFRGFG